MIFSNSVAKQLANLTAVALCGAVVLGCSGGGSSGGGGGPQTTQPPPPAIGAFVAANQGNPTVPSQADAGTQFTLTINGIIGNPAPNFTIKDAQGALFGGGQTSGSTQQVSVTAPSLNVGDADLTWNLTVMVNNAHQGQVSEVSRQVSILIKAPTSGGGGGGGGSTAPVLSAMSLVANNLEIQDNHHSPQFVEVATSLTGIANSAMHWRYAGGATDLVFTRTSDGVCQVVIPSGHNSGKAQEVLSLTVDGYTGAQGVNIPLGNRTASFVSLNRSDAFVAGETSRIGIYSATTINGVTASYEGNPNGFNHVDSAPLSIAGQRMMAGNEGQKAILLRTLADGTGQQKIDVTLGTTNANSSNASFVMTSWDGTLAALLWRNNLVAGGNWQVSVYDAATMTLQRQVDTGIAKGNTLKRFRTVRWIRTGHVMQTYAVFGDTTDKKIVAVGMKDGDVATNTLAFEPEVCSQLLIRNSSHHMGFAVAGNNAGTGNTEYTFIEFGVANIVFETPKVLRNAPAPLTSLIGLGYHHDTNLDKEHLVYVYSGKNFFQVNNITDSTGFLASTKTGYGVRNFVFIPGGVAAFGSVSGGNGHLIMVPVADFSTTAAFQSHKDDIPVSPDASACLGGSDERQVFWEQRGTTVDTLKSYQVGNVIPTSFTLAANRSTTGTEFARSDRSSSVTVRK